MYRLVTLLLAFLVPITAFAADKDNSYKVIYDGGSIQGVKAGADVHLFVAPKQIRIVRGKNEVLATITAESVTEVSYGQDFVAASARRSGWRSSRWASGR